MSRTKIFCCFRNQIIVERENNATNWISIDCDVKKCERSIWSTRCHRFILFWLKQKKSYCVVGVLVSWRRAGFYTAIGSENALEMDKHGWIEDLQYFWSFFFGFILGLGFYFFILTLNIRIFCIDFLLPRRYWVYDLSSFMYSYG